MNEKTNDINVRRRVLGIFTTLLLVFSIVLCLYIAIQVLGKGYATFGSTSFFRVVTGSMEPAVSVGDLIMTRGVDIEELEVGDIITFSSKAPGTVGKIITHRVIDKSKTETGKTILLTKGDANLVADGYYVDSDNLIGKVTHILGNSNFFSQIISFFTSKSGFVVCILLPVMMVSGIMLQSSVKTIKQNMMQLAEELAKEEENEAKTVEGATENDALSQNEDHADTVGVTEEEYREMYDAIRAELIAELKEELIESDERRKTE